MFLAVMVHISLMSLIHYYQMNKTLVKLSKRRTKFQTIYQCILNGISNLYLWNLVLPLPNGEKKAEKMLHFQTFQHQAIVDSIFFLENVIIVILAGFLVHEIPIALLVFVICVHLIGLILKSTYYKFFHIGSPILALKNPCICSPV